MKKKLNIAMIGYQFMGRAHSNAWRQVGRFFDVPFEPVMKVLVGRDEIKLKTAADTLGWQETATNWRDVVGRKDIDLVDICTPGDSHAEIAVAAAAAGKAILCEKPLSNTLSEAEQMVAAVRKASVVNMVCHNYRRCPAVTLAKEIIDAGTLGTLHHFRGVYLQDWPVNPQMPRFWRFEKAKCGSGALGDLLSHSLDLARYLVGEPAEVSALMKTFVTERPFPGTATMAPVDVDDATATLLRFENGAIGTIEASRFAIGRKNHNRLEINGSKGSLVWDLERLNELQLYVDEGPNSGFRTILATNAQHPYFKAWWPEGHLIGYEHSFTHTVFDLLTAIAASHSPHPTFEDGYKNQRALDAIERSANTRQWVRVGA